jgi:hypothetical protein
MRPPPGLAPGERCVDGRAKSPQGVAEARRRRASSSPRMPPKARLVTIAWGGAATVEKLP